MLIGELLQSCFQSFPCPFPAFCHHFGFNLRQCQHGFLRCFHGAFARVGLSFISFVRNQTHSYPHFGGTVKMHTND